MGVSYLEVKVRPLDLGTGLMLPAPWDPTLNPEDRRRLVEMHEWARSESPIEGVGGTLNCGDIVTCYYKYGSMRRSNFTGLRFVAPDATAAKRNLMMLDIAGPSAGMASFFGGATAQMGSMGASPAQLAFENKLKIAIEAAGLPFKVTDRSRTVDDQINRIMNKYNNNGPEEVSSTYGSRGKKMVAAIQAGNQAELRKLAAGSSKHLKGNAIDIRSWHYNDDQITTVLNIIREVGGNPLLENLEGCWTKSGRNVTTTKRIGKAGGSGKNTPCHNEHIHIDIPEDFK